MSMPKVALDKLAVEVPRLRRELEQSNRLWRLLCAVLLVALIVVGVGYYDTHRTVGCLKSWASATSERNLALAGPTARRDAALDQLLIDVSHAAPQATLADELQRVGKASAERQAALAAHPVPPSPALDCGLLPSWLAAAAAQ